MILYFIMFISIIPFNGFDIEKKWLITKTINLRLQPDSAISYTLRGDNALTLIR